MEGGGVDRTAIDCRQHQLVQMVDFPPLLTLLVFDLLRLDAPQIKYQTLQHALMNLVTPTLFEKYVDPKFKVCIYGSVLNSSIYIRMSTMKPKFFCLFLREVHPLGLNSNLMIPDIPHNIRIR